MSKTVRVLSLVSYKFLPPQMGGQKNIAYFNRYLSKLLNLSCITVRENSGNAEPYPVQTIISNSKLRYINPLYFFTLKKYIKTGNITHLIIEHPYYGWLGLLLKWFCKIKLIVHSHNIEALRFKSIHKWWWGILWHYEKFVHRNADHSFFIQTNDMAYAIKNYKLVAAKCTEITFGIESNKMPEADKKIAARKTICNVHDIPENAKILLFNGTLDYKPNHDAIDSILKKINPLLLAAIDFKYKIIICGNKLPEFYNSLADFKEKNILHAGFVDDISLYFDAADIFINPVIEGGGIKTKLVEALEHDCSVVTTESGSTGISGQITANKMLIVNDHDWGAFAEKIISTNIALHTPPTFYENFYWGNIAAKAAAVIIR